MDTKASVTSKYAWLKCND